MWVGGTQSLERPHSLKNDCAVANIEEARAHDSKSKDVRKPFSHNDKMRALAGISTMTLPIS